MNEARTCDMEAALSDNALDGVPELDRVSLRAVLVIEGQDATEALNAAGITDPVIVPVVFDDGSGSAGTALHNPVRGVLELQADGGGAASDGGMMPAPSQQAQTDGAQSDGAHSDRAQTGGPGVTGPAFAAPRTAMFPAGPSGQALAPIRPRR